MKKAKRSHKQYKTIYGRRLSEKYGFYDNNRQGHLLTPSSFDSFMMKQAMIPRVWRRQAAC